MTSVVKILCKVGCMEFRVLMITFDEKHMFNGSKMIRMQTSALKRIIKDDERRPTFLHPNSIFITMIQIHTFEHLCPDINLEQENPTVKLVVLYYLEIRFNWNVIKWSTNRSSPRKPSTRPCRLGRPSASETSSDEVAWTWRQCQTACQCAASVRQEVNYHLK